MESRIRELTAQSQSRRPLMTMNTHRSATDAARAGDGVFDLDIRFIETSDTAATLVNLTDDGCGSTCSSPCATNCG
jgi:FxLD family lantipeptide